VSDQNPDTPKLLRDEIANLARLPAELPVPRLRDAVWTDTVLILGVTDLPGAERDELLALSAVARQAPDDVVNGLLAGLAGLLAAACRRPAVPSLPTLRGFQRQATQLALGWLRHRVGWGS
jgi:hypothetical protein